MHNENEDKVQMETLREDIHTVCESVNLFDQSVFATLWLFDKESFVLNLILTASCLVL